MVIVGPTAAGKSALAMQLAEARSLSIISADSRQVFKGFDVGTAKPSVADRARVPHYGIDVVAPTEAYSAHAWASDATAWSQQATQQHRPPLIVGGTGFYIRALLSPLNDLPRADPTRRTALQRWLDMLDDVEVARWCRALDPARAELGKTQRLRAIETALLSGRRLSEFHATPKAPRRTARYLVIDPGPILAERIRVRVATMVAAGWIDEVAALGTRVSHDARAWKASGYSTIRDYVEGRLDRSTAIERVTIETRQYAKRQRTWFRHQLHEGPVTALNPDASNAFRRVLDWYDRGEADES